MSSSDHRKRLDDIVRNIDAITGYVGDSSFYAFADDRRTVDAVERCIERIAEAVVKIGPERFESIDSALPFERVGGLGDLMRHACDVIDERLIDNLIRQELPGLRAACVAASERP